MEKMCFKEPKFWCGGHEGGLSWKENSKDMMKFRKV